MGSFKQLKVGETGTKIIKGRKITMKRIKSTGFPQFVVIENIPA